MTLKRIISKAQAAKKAGVDRAVITRKTKPGAELFDAVVDGKIDAGHPKFLIFLENRGVDTTTPDLSVPEHRNSEPHPDDGSPEVMISIQEMTLREIGERFGGVEEFSSWLKAIKLAEEIREKRLKNDATDGSMIDREYVKDRVFAYIDEMQRRLLTDTAKTIARQVYAAARSEVSIEQSEREVSSSLSETLKSLKKRVTRSLKDAAPYGDEDRVLEEKPT